MEKSKLESVSFSYERMIGCKRIKPAYQEKIIPAKEVEKLLNNLRGFYTENPTYQTGLVQIAVPALKVDQGAYFITYNDTVENIIVTSKPERGMKFFVADIQQARFGIGQKSRYKRMLSSQSYYIWEDDGGYHSRLLLDNGDWLNSHKVDEAFDWLLSRNGGKAMNSFGWCDFNFLGFKEIGRILEYQPHDGGALRKLVCMINSGTLLDVDGDELTVGKEYRYGKLGDFGPSMLKFKFVSSYKIVRCD